MKETKGEWYRSKRGWVSAALAAVYFILDHVSRVETARNIYRFFLGPSRAVLVFLSPYIPLVLFAIAVLFFEMERRKRSHPESPQSTQKSVEQENQIAALVNSNKEKEATIHKLMSVAPLIDIMISMLVPKGKLGEKGMDIFVLATLTLREPREVEIDSFEFEAIREGITTTVLAIDDVDQWGRVTHDDSNAFKGFAMQPLGRKLSQRGAPVQGWLHFRFDLIESQILNSVLRLKVNAANGSCTHDVNGGLAFPDPKTKGVIRKKGSGFLDALGLEKSQPVIEILTPLNHAEVGLWREVRGSVQPPNSKVQVFVYAGDGVWYMQGPVKVDDFSWNVNCKFGLDNSVGGDFQIIAIADGNIKDKTLHLLPDVGTRSDVIRVRRTH